MSQQILENLGQIGRDLTVAIAEMETRELAAVEAEGKYKVAKAKAFHAAEGSVQAREYAADIATEELRSDYRIAEAMVRVQREHIRALHARIDIGRTLAATERNLAGVS